MACEWKECGLTMKCFWRGSLQEISSCATRRIVKNGKIADKDYLQRDPQALRRNIYTVSNTLMILFLEEHKKFVKRHLCKHDSYWNNILWSDETNIVIWHYVWKKNEESKRDNTSWSEAWKWQWRAGFHCIV